MINPHRHPYIRIQFVFCRDEQLVHQRVTDDTLRNGFKLFGHVNINISANAHIGACLFIKYGYRYAVFLQPAFNNARFGVVVRAVQFYPVLHVNSY